MCLAPFVIYAYPTIAGIVVRSGVPTIVGRYSTFLFAFNLWNLLLFGLSFIVWRRQSYAGLQISLILLIFSTLAVPGNNQLQSLPAFAVTLISVRLFAALTMLVLEFDRFQRTNRKVKGGFLACSMVFLLISFVDFALLGFLLFRSTATQGTRADLGFRDHYNLTEIKPQDIVLVGDSFVWGQGVAKEQRFGDQLEALYAQEGSPTKVYSLGVIGGAFDEYLQVLDELPSHVRAQRVIISFYMNDMPHRLNVRDKIQGLTAVLGRGCPTLGFLGDMTSKVLARSVDNYHDYLVSCFDKSDGSFAARWNLLQTQMVSCQKCAAEHSDAKPLLIILPLMVNFSSYPLEQAHRELEIMAETAGYETIDFLTSFRQQFADGDRFRAGPDDNHFDAAVHAHMAKTLKQRLSRP